MFGREWWGEGEVREREIERECVRESVREGQRVECENETVRGRDWDMLCIRAMPHCAMNEHGVKQSMFYA